MSEKELVAGNGAARRHPLMHLNAAEQVKDRTRLQRDDVGGDADIALAAGIACVKMRSRARRHGDAEHGGNGEDGDHESGRAAGAGDAREVDHCGGFFFGSAGLSAGSSISPKLIEVSAAYF